MPSLFWFGSEQPEAETKASANVSYVTSVKLRHIFHAAVKRSDIILRQFGPRGIAFYQVCEGSCILLDFKNVHLSNKNNNNNKKTCCIWVVVLCLFCFILVIIKYDKKQIQ